MKYLSLILLLLPILLVTYPSYAYTDAELTAKYHGDMSCNELHDALLHNTINGTAHIQRASERYIASCESK